VPVLAARAEPGYTTGMKTAVSVPDAVFRSAERLARQLKKSRSQLYSEALAEYVARRAPDEVTEAYDRLSAAVDTTPEPPLARAAHRVLKRSEW
jgi:antitoxin MazE6